MRITLEQFCQWPEWCQYVFIQCGNWLLSKHSDVIYELMRYDPSCRT